MRLFSNIVQNIREINHRYEKPQIEMTPFVKLCLLVLRLYLLGLVGLLIFKFITTWKG